MKTRWWVVALFAAFFLDWSGHIKTSRKRSNASQSWTFLRVFVTAFGSQMGFREQSKGQRLKLPQPSRHAVRRSVLHVPSRT